jgi:hypothetical protein
MLVGYARVSSVGQSLDVQLDLLKEAGCEKVFAEKKSGRTTSGREKLAEALDFVREGDALVITRLDRLARSVGDLFSILDRLQGKRVEFRCLQQPGVDTDSSTGRLMLAILGAVAAFEADIARSVKPMVSRKQGRLGSIREGSPASTSPVFASCTRAADGQPRSHASWGSDGLAFTVRCPRPFWRMIDHSTCSKRIESR